MSRTSVWPFPLTGKIITVTSSMRWNFCYAEPRVLPPLAHLVWCHAAPASSCTSWWQTCLEPCVQWCSCDSASELHPVLSTVAVWIIKCASCQNILLRLIWVNTNNSSIFNVGKSREYVLIWWGEKMDETLLLSRSSMHIGRDGMCQKQLKPGWWWWIWAALKPPLEEEAGW